MMDEIKATSPPTGTRVNADMQVSSGPCDVLGSGTVISYLSNPIEIRLPGLGLIFKFQDEPEKEGGSTISGRVVEPSTLELTLINFKNPIGSGSGAPMEIGSRDNQRLFLHFRVYQLVGGDKTLHFTVYLERQGGKNAGA